VSKEIDAIFVVQIYRPGALGSPLRHTSGRSQPPGDSIGGRDPRPASTYKFTKVDDIREIRTSSCDSAGQCLRSTASCRLPVECNQCTSSSSGLCVVVAHIAFRRSFPAVFGASVFETCETRNAGDLPEESADIDGICELLLDMEGKSSCDGAERRISVFAMRMGRC
jgi:hypothetical protein